MVEKSRSFVFLEEAPSWFGGLIVGGDVLRGCLPFFSRSRFHFFFWDLDVLGSFVFLHLYLELQSLL